MPKRVNIFIAEHSGRFEHLLWDCKCNFSYRLNILNVLIFFNLDFFDHSVWTLCASRYVLINGCDQRSTAHDVINKQHFLLTTRNKHNQKHLQERNYFTATSQRQYCFAIKLLNLYLIGFSILYWHVCYQLTFKHRDISLNVQKWGCSCYFNVMYFGGLKINM